MDNMSKTTTTKNLGNAVDKHTSSLDNNSSINSINNNNNKNSINTKISNSNNKSLLNSMNSMNSMNNNNESNNEDNEDTKKVKLTGTAATANAVANNSLQNKPNKLKINTKKKNNIPNIESNENLTLKNKLKNEPEDKDMGEDNVNKEEASNLEMTNVISQTETNIKSNSNTEKRISLNRLCMNLLNHQIVMKLYHFQTQQYGAHKASDAYIEKYAGMLDKFLEVAQGIYGKVTLKKYSLAGSSHTDENIIKHINGMITYWKNKINDILDDNTDLINIRDELVADADQLKYLLTFK